jgi:chaperonin GroEL (HSP60 family)
MSSLIDLKSSFGPNGRTKIVKGSTGAILITKDCSQLLDFSFSPYKNNPLFSYELFYFQMIQRYHARYGDGSMTLYLMISSLLSQDLHLLEHRSRSTSVTSISYRSQMLQSLSLLLNSMTELKEAVVDTFIRLSLWKTMLISPQFTDLLCQHILVPASNHAIASNLSHILVRNLHTILSHSLRLIGFNLINGM